MDEKISVSEIREYLEKLREKPKIPREKRPKKTYPYVYHYRFRGPGSGYWYGDVWREDFHEDLSPGYGIPWGAYWPVDRFQDFHDWEFLTA